MTKLKKLERHIGYWLRFVSNHVSLAFAKRLAAYDMGIGDWIVLSALQEHHMLSPAAIAQIMGMTRGATSKLLDRLNAKHLIIRAESTKDRRFQEILLSNEGKKLWPLLEKLAYENEQQFFGHLAKEERLQLIHLLKEIVVEQKIKQIPLN